ncbi:DUF6339 family protein [Nocardia sp. NPDC127526]|uniref:DUF6339 family protein n=1 Tax=Nocardia sp. NPDC127526 TaxID=3345393 RepID=UPI003625C04F
MGRHAVVEIPDYLGVLQRLVMARFLTAGVRAGIENPLRESLLKATQPLTVEPLGRWRSRPVRDLLDEAMRRFDPGDTTVDGWLAPRLHATLRMTRAEAADAELWNYLALVVAPDYVVWRHKPRGSGEKTEAPESRFNGLQYTQAFSRLWWAAELFRNGRDYSPVGTVFRYQEFPNTVLRFSVIDHRPTALAIVRMVDDMIAARTAAIGDVITPLATAINAAASTLVFDVIAPDAVVDHYALHEWISEVDEMPPVPWETLPFGPDDGSVSASTVEALLPLFEELLASAGRRERTKPDRASGLG